MLINRTIDKPDEKIDLLLEYLEQNKIIDQLGFFETKETDFIYCQYLIEEKKLCKILKISVQTLRKWGKSKDSRLKFCNAYDIHNNRMKFGREISLEFRSKSNMRYYSVMRLHDFLQKQKKEKSRIL